MLAAILCTPLAAAAQAAIEAGNLTRATAPAASKAPQAPMQMTISMAPAGAAPVGSAAPVPAADARGPNCTGSVRRGIERDSSRSGKSQPITPQEPVKNRTVGNPNVVQATMVSATDALRTLAARWEPPT
ncbi:hypothetical protein ACTMU2_24260 [Cupriavidus basilensis]